jgi:hypothetical protein
MTEWQVARRDGTMCDDEELQGIFIEVRVIMGFGDLQEMNCFSCV